MTTPIGSPQSERAVVACALLDTKAIYTIASEVSPADFADPVLGEIYAAEVHLASEKKPVEVHQLIGHLQSIGRLDAVGGARALIGLSVAAPSASNVLHYAREVRARARLRAFATAAADLERGAHEAPDADEYLVGAQARLMALAARDPAETFFTAKQWTSRSFKDLERRAENRDPPAVECGLHGVDKALALRPGALVVIAALTSVGKSAFANQVAIGVAERGGHTLISSLEMTVDQLARRFVAFKAGMDMTRLDHPYAFGDADWARVHRAYSDLNALHLSLWTQRGLTIEKLMMRARREHALRPLRLLIVDYIQLVGGDGERRDLVIGAVSSGLKTLAGELNIPVLALSQFSREAAKRGGAPQLSDLRDSGCIEQDADCVGFLFRHEDSNDDTNVTLRFDKNRHGPLSETRMKFVGEHQRFED